MSDNIPALDELTRVAKANGYWHHIEPFAQEIERLRAPTSSKDELKRYCVAIDDLRTDCGAAGTVDVYLAVRVDDRRAAETPSPHDITCNYRNGPLFGPGCICKVVNKHEWSARETPAESDDELAKAVLFYEQHVCKESTAALSFINQSTIASTAAFLRELRMRRSSVETSGDLLIARNALSNLYMAVLKFGPIDRGIGFAMNEAAQVLGSPIQVKATSESQS